MWEDLSLKEKAEMMRIGIQNGISDLNHIKEAYNEYSKGGYAKWKKQIYKHKGINVDNDNTYDYKGFYNAHPNEAWEMLKENSDYHFDDRYKTVYHPTFSTQSIYSGKYHPKYNPTKQVGGTWSNNDRVYTVNKDQYNGPVSMDDRMKYFSENEENGVSMREYDGTYPYLEDDSFWYGVLPQVTVEAPYKGRKKALGGNIFEIGGPEDIYDNIYIDPLIEEPDTYPYMQHLDGVSVSPSQQDWEDIKVWDNAFPEGKPQELLKSYVYKISQDKDPNYYYHNLAKLINSSGTLTISDWNTLDDKTKEKLGGNGRKPGRAYRKDNVQYLDYNNPRMTPDQFMEDYIAEESHLFNDKMFPPYFQFEGLRPDPKSAQYSPERKEYINADYNTPGGNEFNTHRIIQKKLDTWLKDPESGNISNLVSDIVRNQVQYSKDAIRELQKKRRDSKYMVQEDFDVEKIEPRIQNIKDAIFQEAEKEYDKDLWYNQMFSTPYDTKYVKRGKEALEEKYKEDMEVETELRKADKSKNRWWYNGDPNEESPYLHNRTGMYALGGNIGLYPTEEGLLPYIITQAKPRKKKRK